MNDQFDAIQYGVAMQTAFEACLATAAYRLATTGEKVELVADASIAACSDRFGPFANGVALRYFGINVDRSFAEEMTLERLAQAEARRLAVKAVLEARLSGCVSGAKVHYPSV
jgi:hypothetical protein